MTLTDDELQLAAEVLRAEYPDVVGADGNVLTDDGTYDADRRAFAAFGSYWDRLRSLRGQKTILERQLSTLDSKRARLLEYYDRLSALFDNSEAKGRLDVEMKVAPNRAERRRR